jgi:hypothetical protein
MSDEMIGNTGGTGGRGMKDLLHIFFQPSIMGGFS